MGLFFVTVVGFCGVFCCWFGFVLVGFFLVVEIVLALKNRCQVESRLSGFERWTSGVIIV